MNSGTPTIESRQFQAIVSDSIWALDTGLFWIEIPPPGDSGSGSDNSDSQQDQPQDSEDQDEPETDGDDDDTLGDDWTEDSKDIYNKDDIEYDDLLDKFNEKEEEEEKETDDESSSWSLDETLPPKIFRLPGLIDHPSETIREFESWHDFVTCVADDSLYAWGNKTERATYSSHWEESDYNKKGEFYWHGTRSFSQALDMALYSGWPEGRTLLQEFMALISPRPEIYPSIEFSVAGAFPCVPLYCAGDPECMVIDPGSSLRQAKPIIRIDYNNYITANVSPRDMMLRGAAVLSLADSLEHRGFSTELRIVGNAQSCSEKKIFRYSINYKRAGEPLDLDRAAFAIAHPATMRRFSFALLEQHVELKSAFKGGYGIPMYKPNDLTPGTIYVPGSKGGETPDSARLAVQLAAEQVLFPLFEAIAA